MCSTGCIYMLSRATPVLIIAILLQGNFALKFTDLLVPQYVVAGSTVTLQCLYDTEGDEIYSVKWYKGKHEFYRYLPRDRPPKQVYDLPGIKVNMNGSDLNKLTLEEVSLQSAGIYICQVIGEAPSFTTVSRSKEMTVIHLPDKGPIITGLQPNYNVGDIVRVNCTSQNSKPAAILSWTINKGQPTTDNLTEYPKIIGADGLETSISGLEFKVHDDDFKNGELNLLCTATIAPVYYQTYEETVSEGNPEVYHVLESLENSNKGTSHQDNMPLALRLIMLIFLEL